MEDVLKFLKENPTYYLATVDAEGNPQVRPFGTIAKIGDALYIQTGKSKECYKEMVNHPRIAICGIGTEGTSWLRVDADVEPDDSIATCEALLAEYPSLQAMYKPGDGNTVVLKLTNVKATFASFTEAPRTVEF